jgi:streptogramin lyase
MVHLWRVRILGIAGLLATLSALSCGGGGSGSGQDAGAGRTGGSAGGGGGRAGGGSGGTGGGAGQGARGGGAGQTGGASGASGAGQTGGASGASGGGAGQTGGASGGAAGAGGGCSPGPGCCANADCPAMSNGQVGTCDLGTRSCIYACAVDQKACGGSCIPDVGCCTDADCGGFCQHCSTSHVCAAVVSADDPSGKCPGTCDASGVCRSKRGQSCSASAGGCASDSTCSPDGVCCDQACTASCLACDLAGSVGTCTPVPSGAPHGARAACAGTGTTCGGACGDRADGACVYPTGTCGPGPTCLSGTAVGQGSCTSGACATPSAVCASGCNPEANACAVFTTFALPTANCAPLRITVGPDGNLWFTENGCGGIARITTAGVITQYFTGVANSAPWGIVSASDGNLWFTDELAHQIGSVTTAGVIAEYPANTVEDLFGIAQAKSGRLWVTDFDSVGRTTIPSPSVTWAPVPASNPYVFAITPGPDGNLWFVEEGGGNVGRITEAGVITEFSVVPALTVGAALRAIVTGPDGNLWFTENDTNAIGRITPDGLTVRHFPIPTSGAWVDDITVGPDGNLWFTEYLAGKIGRITPTGTITEFSLPGPVGAPAGIVTGPDGNLWITEVGDLGNGPGNNIRRFKM